ncbi:amidase family protein [Actinoplanes sp. NPDC051346]|uniref:amidase n=1 Tax=Actinoplanes sp. NPDC051346 TaxID=3155048 RepID=UPI003420EA88
MDDRLRWIDSAALHRHYATGDLRPTEYVRGVLDAIAEHDTRLRAFLTVDAEGAMAQAQSAERELRTEGMAALRARPLLGVPVSVKDLTPTRGLRTTRGSRALRDWIPDEDAPAVARLRAAGAIVIGKTNTSEGGWSASTRNRIAESTANPWDRTRTAGGSSGGAAAAVAAGLGVAATGTDGAGSIRIPAALCGVVGFKPTFGRVPYVPLSVERLSHLGPLARSVHDAALLTDVMSGPDPRDPYSLFPGARTAAEPPAVLRIGWIPEPGGAVSHPDVAARCAAAVAALADLGHEVTELASPFEDPYPALVRILAAVEAAGQPPEQDHLADPDRMPVVSHGRGLSAADLLHAEQGRATLVQQMHTCMSRWDLLAMPTVAVPPFDRDRWCPPSASGHDPAALDWLAWAAACHPFNLTGQPAVSVPVGHGSTGLPVGLQLVGVWNRDDLVLHAAGLLETALPWMDSYLRLEST